MVRGKCYVTRRPLSHQHGLTACGLHYRPTRRLRGGGYNRFMLDANRKTLYDFASMQTLNDRYLASANRRRPWPN